MKFDPQDIEDLTGWTPAGIRDLRNKDMLGAYGAQRDNGRWTYSERDVVAFWIAGQFNSIRSDAFATFLRGVFAAAHSGAEKMIAAIKGNPPRDVWTVYLHSAARADGEVGGSEIIHVAALSELDGRAFDRAEIFNWSHMAATAPEQIRKVALIA